MIDPSQMQQGAPMGAPQGQGLPPELMQMLQGAGQGMPQADPSQGLPPELMQALMGGGGDPNAPPDQPDQGQQQPPDFYSTLQQAMDMLKGAQPPDAQDQHNVDKLVAGLSKILATHEKEHQQAMGGNAGQLRAMSRAYGA